MSTLIDMSVIEGLKEIGDQEFVSELIEMFLQQSDEIMEDIKNHSEKRDGDSLSKSSHKLKGSCLNLGAIDMSKVCQDIETNSREGNLTNMDEKLNNLQDIYSQTSNELKKLM